MKNTKKAFMSVIFAVLTAFAVYISAAAETLPEDISLSHLLVIIEESCDVEEIIRGIDCDSIESVRELTNPDDYEDSYTPMLLVEIKNKSEENLLKAKEYFENAEYVLDIRYDYFVGGLLPEFLPGDADSDGRLTAADARRILRYSVGLSSNDSDYYREAIDADYDGRITASDARAVLRISVGLEKIPEMRTRKTIIPENY